MKAAVSLSTLLDKQLVCVDHMLNNCLKDTLENGEVKVIVDKCKRLAQRTHQSTKDWYEIKQECESLECNPIKLIQPVQTRWNSNAMLFKSVLRNEQGLKSVRDNSLNANLTILPSRHKTYPIRILFVLYSYYKDNTNCIRFKYVYLILHMSYSSCVVYRYTTHEL